MRELAMGQVVCSRVQSCEIRRKSEGCVYAFFWIDASTVCPEQRGGTNDQSRHSGLDAAYSSVRHQRKPGQSRLAGSPARNATPRFAAHCFKCCGMGLPRRATPPLHLVTLALHARNAKKIFAESHSVKSTIPRVMACNVGKNTSIFPENTRISCAVYHSIDRLMLSKTRTTDFLHSPSSASATARIRTRGQRILLCRASSGGVS